MSVFDRDTAREVLRRYFDPYPINDTLLLDALEGCVRPVPAQTIDRDTLAATIARLRAEEALGKALRLDQEWADCILALLRLADDVTREEAR